MASDSERFDRSGPTDLTCVDWNNAHHRRSVAACLVQGVYRLEMDREERREGPQALAPPWWEFFGFQLQHKLMEDSSIFGAIFEYRPLPSSGNHTADGPRFVVAFRGTLLQAGKSIQDIELNILLVLNDLHSTPRCKTAIRAVEKMVATARNSGVWLAGHSLGSAIALVAGKNMAKRGSFLESFLFNPPYVSLIEKIKNETWKTVADVTNVVASAAVALGKRSPGHLSRSADSFAALSPWVPQLFVNKADFICSGYIGYFRRRNMMQEYGAIAEAIQRVASLHSWVPLLMKENETQAEPVHLIPSANLTINIKPPAEFKKAHGILEWCKRDLSLQSQVYKYK